MARFNSKQSIISVTGTTTLTYVLDGAAIVMTGSSGYALTLAGPAAFSGTTQTIWNNTASGDVTITTASGQFVGYGASASLSITLPLNNVIRIISDGTNYFVAKSSYVDDVQTLKTTFNLANATATTINFGGAATSVRIGASTGTSVVKNQLIVVGRQTDITATIASGNYTYDGTGKITNFVDGNKTTSAITYDGLGRISGFTETIVDANGSGTYTVTRTVTYTARNDPIIA